MKTRSQNAVQWVMTRQNISQDLNVRTGILAQAIFSWAKAESRAAAQAERQDMSQHVRTPE